LGFRVIERSFEEAVDMQFKIVIEDDAVFVDSFSADVIVAQSIVVDID
jgi:hypothetical protein